VHQVSRKGTKLGGIFLIYDGREDAIAHGISAERIKHWKDYSLAIGDYAEYPDGCISEVIRVYGSKTRIQKKTENGHGGKSTYKANHITTRLNCYSQSQSTVMSKCLSYSASTMRTKPETLSTARVRFAEDWLLGGLAIEASCKKHLWQARQGTGNGMPIRTFAYMVLTLPWFDELLKSNRLIRDRYMTLVGALGGAGIDEVYIANQLKKDMDGELQADGTVKVDTKRYINAINNAIELLEASAAKKRIPINASWQELPTTTPKQLSEPANINSILEDTLHERIGSEVSKTTRVKAVPAINQEQRSDGGLHQTNRDASVSPESSDRERLSIPKQVFSAVEV